jgi:hypothetical protein
MKILRQLALAVGAALSSAPVVVSSVAAQPNTALACAKADLALMYKLADEHGTATVAADLLARAALKVIDARAACRGGDYARGLVLYSEADALTSEESSPTPTERR